MRWRKDSDRPGCAHLPMRSLPKLLIASWALFALTACVSTPQESIEHGRRVAEGTCARCHAVRAQGGSPNAFAPAFRDLRRTRSIASIEDTFAHGLIVAHPPMPAFAVTPGDMEDVLDYIRSIQTQPAEPWPGRMRQGSRH